jgi:hypothetical protein
VSREDAAWGGEQDAPRSSRRHVSHVEVRWLGSLQPLQDGFAGRRAEGLLRNTPVPIQRRSHSAHIASGSQLAFTKEA